MTREAPQEPPPTATLSLDRCCRKCRLQCITNGFLGLPGRHTAAQVPRAALSEASGDPHGSQPRRTAYRSNPVVTM